MTRRSPTAQLRNKILAIVTGELIAWTQGASIDVSGVHSKIDALIDAFAADDARRRETRRRRQVAELLKSKR